MIIRRSVVEGDVDVVASSAPLLGILQRSFLNTGTHDWAANADVKTSDIARCDR